MRNRDIDKALREACRPDDRSRDRRRGALRAELAARHRRTYPRNRRWKIMTHRMWFRPAMACLALMTVGIVACTTPTEYDVDLGKQLTVNLDGVGKASDVEPMLQEMSAWVEGRPGVEKVWVAVEETDDGPASASFMVWGQHLDAAALEAGLRARFLPLEDADIAVSDLEGKAQGSLAEAMGHAVFNLEVSGETAEEVRANILAALAAGGFTGDAQVEVSDEHGERTVKINLEDVQEVDGQEHATEDELIIELKSD